MGLVAGVEVRFLPLVNYMVSQTLASGLCSPSAVHHLSVSTVVHRGAKRLTQLTMFMMSVDLRLSPLL